MIFMLSAETAAESSATSGGFLNWLLNTFYSRFAEMTEAEQAVLTEGLSFWIRKTAHFFMYTVLGVLSFLNGASYRSIRLGVRAVSGEAFCVLYAVTDEWHQTFVSGRSGELRDVLIDGLGALFGILLCCITVRLFPRLYSFVSFSKVGMVSKSSKEERFKMRKSELLSQYIALSDELQQLKLEISRLHCELEEYKRISEVLKDEVVNAQHREQSPLMPLIKNETANQTATIDDELGSDSVYGAQVIGRIVLSAAEYSNRLSCGGEVRYKELINLILGHTEVEKANILEIVMSDASSEDKKRMIDSCENSAKEYFDSVMAQITTE